MWLFVNHSLSAFEIAEETERRFFTWQNVIFDLIWSVPKPTVKSTLCGREHLPICRQQICVQSPKLVCMQLSKSPVCSAEGNHEINIDETATVKRSVWFWSLLPGLMAPCRSDFGFVVERERQGSFSVLAWPEPSVWVGCDSYTDDQSLGNPRPLFVISNTISSSHYTEMHSTISDHYMNMRPGDICTIRLPLYSGKK